MQLRIVAGSLRGRKLTCDIHEGLRPTPQMVREALFSILGNAVPDRVFVDLFAGTGANGLEALSRGASETVFVERDIRLAGDIERRLRDWDVAQAARVLRTDAYRWAERWPAPSTAVNVFVSPPFADYQRRIDGLLKLVADLKAKLAPTSVLVLQAEESPEFNKLLDGTDWDVRRYGRNILAFWVKEEVNHRNTETPRSEEEETGQNGEALST